jgi:hypothetical protein
MNTSNTFLCFFPANNEEDKHFISIADLDHCGTPIIADGDDEGDEMDCDNLIYRFDGTNYIAIL